ncbi:hypothetical protein L6452_27766 [Arctium lappa]|uniref:Uncharacterized protein n=1 Tax=Arctium lappa TaxID=4217 RepID=A0ACB8ZWR6_ARCLA|nr:hypothetical protein L6452_27766 [Arctium lappa]
MDKLSSPRRRFKLPMRLLIRFRGLRHLLHEQPLSVDPSLHTKICVKGLSRKIRVKGLLNVLFISVICQSCGLKGTIKGDPLASMELCNGYVYGHHWGDAKFNRCKQGAQNTSTYVFTISNFILIPLEPPFFSF